MFWSKESFNQEEMMHKRVRDASLKELKDIAYEIKHHLSVLVIAMAALAFVFDAGTSFTFIILLSFAGSWLSHHFHLNRHHFKAYEMFIIYSTFLFPLMLYTVWFKDFFSLSMLFIYAVSLITSAVIYMYHKRAIHFSRIMVSVTYSHIVALTSALLVAVGLSYFIHFGKIVSVFYLVLTFLLPVMFVYFFFSKYLYLHFFDKAHVKLDIIKGLKHGFGFALIFVTLFMVIYGVAAAQFTNIQGAYYEEYLQDVRTDLAMLGDQAGEYPTDLTDSLVVAELRQEILDLTVKVETEEARFKTASNNNFVSYLTDSYFNGLVKSFSKTSDYTFEVGDIRYLTNSITSNFDEFHEEGISRNSSALDAELERLEVIVDANWKSFEESDEAKELRARLDLETNSYDALHGDGLIAFKSYEVELESLNEVLEPGSMFGKAMLDLALHTRMFSEVLKFTAGLTLDFEKHFKAPDTVVRMYDKRGVVESPLSKAVRYRVLADHIESSS